MRIPHSGLKFHAAIVCSILFALLGILGIRAWSVAQLHSRDTHRLVRQLNTQALLVRLEALEVATDQTRRKLEITHDPQYSALLAQETLELGRTAREVRRSLAGSGLTSLLEPSGSLDARIAGIQALQTRLDRQRDEELRRAEGAAYGLYRLIGLALILCLGLAAWLGLLFYRGLIEPLASLTTATARIREGQLSHRIGRISGVAELRELTGSFNSMAERLEALDRAKAEFLATISHEIKNPLAALKEGLNFLSVQDGNLSPQSRAKGFGACLIASKRLEAMINNLLKISRGEQSLFEFDLSRKCLNDAIQCAIDEVRPMAEKRGMQVSLQASPELVASFSWDGIVQVFENLLLNAIKYGEEGSRIEVTAAPSGERGGIEITVTNEGRPIPEAESVQVFDRFYRASNSSRQQGLGIGLHVVKEIIRAHQGSVSASSREGRTCLRLWLPGAVGLLLATGLATGCASVIGPRAEPEPAPTVASLPELESKVRTPDSDTVTVPVQVLRDLLESKRQLDARYRELDVRFNALKDIDLERRP